jgi:hypothetical protein
LFGLFVCLLFYCCVVAFVCSNPHSHLLVFAEQHYRLSGLLHHARVDFHQPELHRAVREPQHDGRQDVRLRHFATRPGLGVVLGQFPGRTGEIFAERIRRGGT